MAIFGAELGYFLHISQVWTPPLPNPGLLGLGQACWFMCIHMKPLHDNGCGTERRKFVSLSGLRRRNQFVYNILPSASGSSSWSQCDLCLSVAAAAIQHISITFWHFSGAMQLTKILLAAVSPCPHNLQCEPRRQSRAQQMLPFSLSLLLLRGVKGCALPGCKPSIKPVFH